MMESSKPVIKRTVKLFSTEEESIIGKFMINSWGKHFRVPQNILFDCLKSHVEKFPRTTRSKDNRPSSFWQQRFSERNPSVVSAYKSFKALAYKEFPPVTEEMLEELLQKLSKAEKPLPPLKSKLEEPDHKESSPDKARLVGPNAIVRKQKKSLESSSGSEDIMAKVRKGVIHKRSKTVEDVKRGRPKKSLKLSPAMFSKQKDDSLMDDVKTIIGPGTKEPPKETTKNKKTLVMESPQVGKRASIHPDAVPLNNIKFEANENLEAMDCGKWYRAKIVEVYHDKNQVLVHFNGWGKRFDTIFMMDSELIRGPSQLDKKVDVQKFKVGDDVLSQWTDGNFYPGTVIAVKDSGSYLVMFFDGLKKLVRPNLLKPITEKEKEDAMKAAQQAYLVSINEASPKSPQHDIANRKYRTSANDRERRTALRKEPVELQSEPRRGKKRKFGETVDPSSSVDSRQSGELPKKEASLSAEPASATLSSEESSKKPDVTLPVTGEAPSDPVTPPKVFSTKRARIDKISDNLLDKAVTTLSTSTTTAVTTSTSSSSKLKQATKWGKELSDSDSPLVIDESEGKSGQKSVKKTAKESSKRKQSLKKKTKVTKSEEVLDNISKSSTSAPSSNEKVNVKSLSLREKHKMAGDRVLSEECSLDQVAEEFGIDVVEFRESLLQRGGVISGLWQSNLLPPSSESKIVSWIHDMTDAGWAITDLHISQQIKTILTQQNMKVVFNNFMPINFPSTTWLSEFLERHPEIFPGRKKPLDRFRFDREGFEEWLMRWSCALRVAPVVPNLVYYCDQTVFDARLMHEVEFIVDGVKINIAGSKNKMSMLTCIGAEGVMLEPFHLLPGESAVMKQTMGYRKQGVVDSDVMLHWMREVFIPGIPPHRPVALLLDLHLDQLTHELLSFTNENNIILYRFLPAAAHFLQHPDQKLFGRLRLQWKKTLVSKFLKEHSNQSVALETFQDFFKTECAKVSTSSNIKMCFELTKIYSPVSKELQAQFILKQESKEKRNKRKLSKPIIYLQPLELNQPKKEPQKEVSKQPPTEPEISQLNSPHTRKETGKEFIDESAVDTPKVKHVYKKGETVLAKWADCRLYFATILKCMGDDAYKIRYYDGLVKVVKEDFLRPYSGEIPKLPPAPPKLSSPKRHRSEDNRPKAALGLNRPQSADRSRRVSESNSVDTGTRSKQAKISESILHLAPESRVRYKQGEQVLCRWTDRRFYPATVLKQKGIDHYLIKYYDNRKKVVKHDWLSPWKPPTNQGTAKIESTNEKTAKDKSTDLDSKPESTNQKTSKVKTANQVKEKPGTNKVDEKKLIEESTSEEKAVVSDLTRDGNQEAKSPESGRFGKGDTVLARWTDCRSYPATVLAAHLNDSPEQYTVQYYDGMIRKLNKEMVSMWDPNAIPKVTKRGRPKTKERSDVMDISKGTIPVTSTSDEINRFKCKVPGCSKVFRNQASLKQHHKHSHKRRKPSEENLKVSKEKRGTSVPHKSDDHQKVEIKSRGGKPMLEILRMQQDLPLEGDEPMIEEPAVGDLDDKTTEENEANLSDEPKTNDEMGKVVKNEQSKEIRNEDVIRCVCSSEIEDGFMIQCDACYTWQHAVCEGISHNREGQSYVCKICKEPPGGRKSKQYLYNNEFITKGVPPSIFPNKEVTPEEKKFQNFMEATHKLVEEVMRVKSALAVMREKINIANPSSDHPMLRMFNETLDDGNHSSISAGVKETELGDGAVVKKDTCQPTKVTGCQMTSNEEELVRCRGNLLAHIDRMEEQLSTRTTQLEDYVTELERGVSLPEEALGSLKSDIDSIYKLLTQAVTSQ